MEREGEREEIFDSFKIRSSVTCYLQSKTQPNYYSHGNCIRCSLYSLFDLKFYNLPDSQSHEHKMKYCLWENTQNCIKHGEIVRMYYNLFCYKTKIYSKAPESTTFNVWKKNPQMSIVMKQCRYTWSKTWVEIQQRYIRKKYSLTLMR